MATSEASRSAATGERSTAPTASGPTEAATPASEPTKAAPTASGPTEAATPASEPTKAPPTASGPTKLAPTASERITSEVTSWPGVAAGPGRRGELSFRVGRREIGHLHGDHAAHFNFPKTVWSELIGQGRIEPHPVFPNAQGPAARRIRDDDDVADVLVLMRLNYDRLTDGDAGAATREAGPTTQPEPDR